MLIATGSTLLLIAVLLVAAHFLFRPPSLAGRSVSEAVRASKATRLGRAVRLRFPHPNNSSGVVALRDGPEAFAARIAVIEAAEAALDVQYYIWQRDATGLILLDELRRAAERGVRVRLLLDDNGTRGLDAELVALDALPNMEVRLFNPFILRRPKALGFAFDFVRLNRRMHNKSLTADGAISILGGRNIGNIYFGFGSGAQFIDTDVLVAAGAAADVGADFDRYWHCASSHPVARIIGAPVAGAMESLIADAAEARTSEEGRLYFGTLHSRNIIRRLEAGDERIEWTTVTLVSDDPAKGIGAAETRDLLFPQLMALLMTAARSVDLVSAYFVPGKRFSRRLSALAQAGIRVRILTNSQAATDVTVVHSAYVKYRPGLLRSGVALHELKPGFSVEDGPELRRRIGATVVSLHSKTLAIDGQRIFIGSFNFDPRSMFLNTEMGVLIDSPQISGSVADAFANRFQLTSYIPELTRRGSIIWEEPQLDGQQIRHRTEPGTNPLSRLFVRALGILPIEWLL